ncbi:hypothetical protein V8F33_013088 [Rhypophila sp. PSN 637]
MHKKGKPGKGGGVAWGGRSDLSKASRVEIKSQRRASQSERTESRWAADFVLSIFGTRQAVNLCCNWAMYAPHPSDLPREIGGEGRCIIIYCAGRGAQGFGPGEVISKMCWVRHSLFKTGTNLSGRIGNWASEWNSGQVNRRTRPWQCGGQVRLSQKCCPSQAWTFFLTGGNKLYPSNDLRRSFPGIWEICRDGSILFQRVRWLNGKARMKQPLAFVSTCRNQSSRSSSTIFLVSNKRSWLLDLKAAPHRHTMSVRKNYAKHLRHSSNAWSDSRDRIVQPGSQHSHTQTSKRNPCQNRRQTTMAYNGCHSQI